MVSIWVTIKTMSPQIHILFKEKKEKKKYLVHFKININVI